MSDDYPTHTGSGLTGEEREDEIRALEATGERLYALHGRLTAWVIVAKAIGSAALSKDSDNESVRSLLAVLAQATDLAGEMDNVLHALLDNVAEQQLALGIESLLTEATKTHDPQE